MYVLVLTEVDLVAQIIVYFPTNTSDWYFKWQIFSEQASFLINWCNIIPFDHFFSSSLCFAKLKLINIYKGVLKYFLLNTLKIIPNIRIYSFIQSLFGETESFSIPLHTLSIASSMIKTLVAETAVSESCFFEM